MRIHSIAPDYSLTKLFLPRDKFPFKLLRSFHIRPGRSPVLNEPHPQSESTGLYARTRGSCRWYIPDFQFLPDH